MAGSKQMFWLTSIVNIKGVFTSARLKTCSESNKQVWSQLLQSQSLFLIDSLKLEENQLSFCQVTFEILLLFNCLPRCRVMTMTYSALIALNNTAFVVGLNLRRDPSMYRPVKTEWCTTLWGEVELRFIPNNQTNCGRKQCMFFYSTCIGDCYDIIYISTTL